MKADFVTVLSFRRFHQRRRRRYVCEIIVTSVYQAVLSNEFLLPDRVNFLGYEAVVLIFF